MLSIISCIYFLASFVNWIMPKYIIKPIEDLPDLLTIGQASRILGCHTNTLRNWEKDGKIQTVRIGNRKDRRFKKTDIVWLMEEYVQ